MIKACPECGSEKTKIVTLPSKNGECLFCNDCKSVTVLTKVKVKSERKCKFCPFCPPETREYKTKIGLLKHVLTTHSFNLRKRKTIHLSDVAFLRIQTTKGVVWEAVSGWDEVEKFLKDYWRDYKNPSTMFSRFWKYVES